MLTLLLTRAGWDEGVPQLSLGQKAKLICTPDYAYGERGFPPVIPANSTLIFGPSSSLPVSLGVRRS